MSAESHSSPATELIPDESAEELYEMAPCGYLTTNIEGRIVKVNRTFLEWTGYSRSDLTGGKRLVDLLTAGGRMFYETHLNLLLRVQSAVDEIALDLVCRDGRVLPVLINGRQKRNAEGEPIVNRFTVFNSTERRMYERQLLATRDLLQTTLASIGDGVVATDAAGRITFLNPVAEKLSGWSNDAAVGKPIDEVLILVNEETSAKVENPVFHALWTGVIVGMANHTALISKKGECIPVDDSASPIRDATGKAIGAVLVFRNISERREAEKALQLAHAELEKNAAELRRSNEDLSQFAYVASHDLRSPLNTVVQFAGLLERDYGQQLGNGKELLEYLTGAARNMARLIDDLLLYARVSSETARTAELTDANAPFATALHNLGSAIASSGATITQDALPAVPVEATSLVQIFQNLIGNAMHYRSTEAPRIHVSASEQGNQWLFRCNDNGVGIAAEYHAQIFEPFKRLHGHDRPGSGIGLAVCKKIVARYGGKLWVESEVGQGSSFLFTLPKQ